MDSGGTVYVDPSLAARVDYACRIVRDFFGALPEIVVRFLFTVGPSTLREVRIGTGLNRKDASRALMVLVQHSYVQALLFEEIVGARSIASKTMYKADPRRIITSVRQPAFLMHVADNVGEWAERVCEQCVFNGRLTFQGIVGRLVAEAGDKTEAEVTQHAASAVVHLLRQRYIEQVPPCEMPLVHLPDKRKAAKGKNKAAEDQKKLEAGHKLTVANYHKMRYQLPDEVLAASMSDLGAGPTAPAADQAADVTLLRLNFEAFCIYFHHRACVDLMATRYGPGVAEVVRALLDLARPNDLNSIGKDADDCAPASVTAGVIREQMAQNAAARGEGAMEEDVAVDEVLQSLIEFGLVQESEAREGEFFFDQQHAAVEMQSSLLSAHLKRRFGERGHRVWRLVLEHSYLQSNHIERLAMINTRAVRTIVYGLFKHGYMSVQEVPKSSDRAPSKMFYLYHVDFFRALAQLLHDLYTAAGNLLARATFEMDREKDVLELAQRKMRGDSIKMSAAQLKAASKLQGVVKALHASFLQLDGMLAVTAYA